MLFKGIQRRFYFAVAVANDAFCVSKASKDAFCFAVAVLAVDASNFTNSDDTFCFLKAWEDAFCFPVAVLAVDTFNFSYQF